MAPSRSRSFDQSRRKQRLESNLDVVPPNNQQATISKLFAASQDQATSSLYEVSPSTKRRKLTQDWPEDAGPTLISGPVSLEAMYNFATPRSPNVIDLTKSPTGRSRRVSGGARVDHFSAQNGPRKLVVKNLRTTTKTDPDQYCQKIASSLDDALRAIYKDERPVVSNEELYRGVENLCRLGKAPELSKKVMESMDRHVSVDVAGSLASQAAGDDRTLLSVVLAAWAKWSKQLVCPCALA